MSDLIEIFVSETNEQVDINVTPNLVEVNVIKGITDLTLTTTGNSGASTYNSSTKTLNVPNYTLSGLGGVGGTGTTNYLPKFTGSTTLGNSLIYDNGTNVGIGTTSPYSPLQVGNYIGAGGFSYGAAATFVSSFNSSRATLFVGSTDTTSTQDKGGSIDFGGGSEAGSTPYTFARIKGYKEVSGGGYSGYLSFSTTPSNSDANTERMRITSSGNVGIGTTSPSSKLHVVGIPSYADNAAALAGGLTAGAFYHTLGILKIVI